MARVITMAAGTALMAAALFFLAAFAGPTPSESAEKGTCAAALCGHVIF